MTHDERLAILETKVGMMMETNLQLREKLDVLLELRHKGMGAFWLASGLLGTTVMGAIFAFISWMKGHL